VPQGTLGMGTDGGTHPECPRTVCAGAKVDLLIDQAWLSRYGSVGFMKQ
jgi:hypothetical protein